MKRNKWLLLLLVVLMTVTACSRERGTSGDPAAPGPGQEQGSEAVGEKEPPAEEIIPPSEEGAGGDEPLEEDVEAPEETIYPVHDDNPLLQPVKEGKMEGIPFGIGTSTEEILLQWGEPDEMDYFLGGLFMVYDIPGVVFFTSAYWLEEEMGPGEVVHLSVISDQVSFFNVSLQHTIPEIIQVLGEPSRTQTPEDTQFDELHNSMWTLTYYVGDYELVFGAPEETGASIMATLSHRP